MWCCTDHRRWNKENGIPSLNQWSEIPKFLFKNATSKVGEYKFLDLFPGMSHFVSLFLLPPVTLTPESICTMNSCVLLYICNKKLLVQESAWLVVM